MLLKIGTRPAGGPAEHLARVSDPVELLVACHGRIRSFTAMAARLAAAAGAPNDDIASAAGQIHRYFTVALPLHQVDEEESIRPRLDAAGVPREVTTALENMVGQHVDLDATIAELVPRWAALQQEPGRLGGLSGPLATTTTRLLALWDAHLPPEEAIIFPALARFLTAEARQDILNEIRARRAPVVAEGFPSDAARRLGGGPPTR